MYQGLKLSMDDKKALRGYYRKLRTELDPEVKSVADVAVAQRVIALAEYKKSRMVLAYVSGPIEVGTRQIMEESFREKTVLCPRCEHEGNIMHFCRVRSFDDLEKGRFGIYEPKSSCPVVTEFEDAVCLVPGLSYDRYGFRLGFGRGFYDRFLADFKGTAVGLCYESCLTDELPRGSFDIRTEIIVTEGQIIRPSGPMERKDDNKK